MSAQWVANALNALSKLQAATGTMLPEGWAALARVVECTAPMKKKEE
jgi:hypothetical protein